MIFILVFIFFKFIFLIELVSCNLLIYRIFFIYNFSAGLLLLALPLNLNPGL